MGRLPVGHLPRRRRGRDRQPQREADDALLPRGRRGRAGELPAACGRRRRDRPRRHRAQHASTSRRCSSASTPPPAGSRCCRSRPRRASSRSTCSPSATTTSPGGRSPSAGAARGGPRRRRAAGARHARRPTTSSVAQRWFEQFEGAGLDGLIAKKLDLRYQPDKRVMTKVKHERTADCVVAGYRVHKSGPDAHRLAAARALRRRRRARLGRRGRRLPDGAAPRAARSSCSRWSRRSTTTRGRGRSRSRAQRTPAQLRDAAGGTPARTSRSSRCAPSGSSRCGTTTWRASASGTPTQFVRWRPDRDPRSCTYDQLERPVSFDLADVLTGS